MFQHSHNPAPHIAWGVSHLIRTVDTEHNFFHPGRKALGCLAALLLGASSSLFAQGLTFGDSEPLSAEQAYIPAVTAESADQIRVDWTIADGYYLYRDKLKFSLATANGELALASPDYPPALTETDAFFGESAVFRGDTRIPIAVTDVLADGGDAVLSVHFQGCADIGLCYPPTTVELDVTLPPAGEIVAGGSILGQSARGSSLFSDTPSANLSSSSIASSSSSSLDFGLDHEEELLRPEEAYLPLVTSVSTTTLDLLWTIEDGYYLYRDKLQYSLQGQTDPLPLLERTIGVEQHDEFYGDTYVNRGEARAKVALGNNFSVGDEGMLVVAYQGCADIGVCFPPSKIDIPFVVSMVGEQPQAVLAAVATAGIGGAASGGTGAPTGTPLVSEHDRLSGLLANGSLWLAVATFFGLGVLLAFTPCVLPMMPILSSLIVGQRDKAGGELGSGRAFRLSAVYVLVMATTYAVAGVLVALSGKNVQIWLQNPIVLSLFAALFVVFALAMFGLFEFQMPRAIQSRLTNVSNAQKGGGYRGVVTMGFLSTLIVGPCVTAPLAGALLYIADTGDAWVGGAALFALGLGMGFPLLLLGTSAAKLLPKAGVWMERVKQGFGVLMLGMAIWMLSRFLSPEITTLLAGLLVLGTGIWLGGTDQLRPDSSGWARTAKFAGVATAIYGAAVLLGALGGGSSLTRPLAVFTGGSGTAVAGTNLAESEGLVFQQVKSVEDLDRVVASARSEGRAVMLDFYADWCVSCKEMEHFTFTDDRVQGSLDGVILVQADVTANDDVDKALLDRFRLFAPPAIVFFDPAGREIPGARVVGFVPAGKFSDHVDKVMATTTASR